MEDGKFLTASGVTAGVDAGYAFLAQTYVAPEDRRSVEQALSPVGDRTAPPGFDFKKALDFARTLGWSLEHQWQEDPSNDPFV